MADEKVDPRIQRTKDHVLDTALALLRRAEEPLTFSTLALAARVSRKTLYTHWGSIESVIIESFIRNGFAEFDPDPALTVDDRVAVVVNRLSDYLVDESAATALNMVMAAAAHDPVSRAYLATSRTRMTAVLSDYIAPMEVIDYAILMGPLLYMAQSAGEVAPDVRLAVIQNTLARLNAAGS
jgi:AcrR family transcriptional regulator